MLSNKSLIEQLRAQEFDAVLCEHLPDSGMVATTVAGVLNLPVVAIDPSTAFWNPPPGVPQVK